jgi:hypothetical protein
VADCLLREKPICPRSSTKPDRRKISTFCSATPGRRLLGTVAPPSVLPTNCSALCLALCFESLTSLTVHLHDHLCSPVWELDGKSSPHPFKKIRNIPWGHVYAMQLAHPFKKKRKEKKHPWGMLLVPPNWHSSHALS